MLLVFPAGLLSSSSGLLITLIKLCCQPYGIYIRCRGSINFPCTVCAPHLWQNYQAFIAYFPHCPCPHTAITIAKCGEHSVLILIELVRSCPYPFFLCDEILLYFCSLCSTFHFILFDLPVELSHFLLSLLQLPCQMDHLLVYPFHIGIAHAQVCIILLFLYIDSFFLFYQL